MKILLTGENGLLGSALRARLTEAGHTVIPFGADIRDEKAVEFFAKERFDWIIHTAAVTDVSLCEKDPQLCRDTNVVGTRNLISLATATSARFLFISTVSVFSGERGNYVEEDVPHPQNVYNTSKVLGEESALSYPRSLCVRLNLIGVHPTGSRGKNFFEWLFDSLRGDKDITLFTDVRINPLSPATAADILSSLIEKNPTDRILHIGSRTVLSKAAIGEIALRSFSGYKGKVTYGSVDALPGPVRPKEMWLNTNRVEAEYGIGMPSLESEIEKILHASL